MLQHNAQSSHIIIATDIDLVFQNLQERFYPSRVVGFITDEFKIEDAKAVMAEAYLSDSTTKYIVLGAKNFNTISQNSLLKVLEEPPKNIQFIIISPTKSILLPTIRSRLPIIKGDIEHTKVELELNLAHIDYAEVFKFLKENSRIKKNEAQLLVEAIYRRATIQDKLILSLNQLENFEKAYKLLELNSRPQSVLAMLIMSFVQER